MQSAELGDEFANGTQLSPEQATPKGLARVASQRLVRLFREFFDRNAPERQRRATSLGSGFIIDASGFVVTNNHVIADADEISVIMQDNERFDATVIGRDPKRADLVLLERDPLEDLDAFRSKRGIMVRGRWIPQSEIDKRLRAIEASSG